ncbi:signal peptide peptidase SppA [Stutzerimonas azotifigens]|uniref:signal peptide peptidase SppA n=1 Tax=Stutzerimonas azotifigens TaxID=291995 RepID=UPI000404522D|nr:signal peptide peptidase SppA [Stutzerimonas azotifigens]
MSDEWKAPSAGNDDQKSWKLLERTLQASIQEQRRARRWGIFFKLLTFAYLFFVLFMLSPALQLGKSVEGSGHTAVVNVRGMIADDEAASADNVIGALREAFEDPNTRGIVMRINSPGGSPVQSGYIYDEIRRLRGEHPDIKVYAVITDLGASGAYYIASAADEIYANRSSLVGSIGVTATTFGFVEAIDRLGVERRVYTSGEHKAFLDPFQPQKPEETAFWQNVLQTTHRQFIDAVKQGRGDRLQDERHPELFSGLIWSGEQALELGLIDGLASTGEVARNVIGAPETVDFTVKGSPLERLSRRLGASIAEHLALWAGLQAPVLR